MVSTKRPPLNQTVLLYSSRDGIEFGQYDGETYWAKPMGYRDSYHRPEITAWQSIEPPG